MPDVLVDVRPAYFSIPPHASTSGGEAADLAESIGLVLDGAQRFVLDALLAERADRHWAAFEAAIIEARQNGKTRGLQALALADLFLFGAQLTIWTAHLFDTAQEAFRDIVELIDGADHLRREVKTVHRARGDEGVELLDGRRLNFLARSKTGGRGLSGDRVILDEAFALTPAEMGSLLPTMSARPNPQVIYASSAGLMSSDVLRTLRDRGRAGDDPTLVYIEWCSPGSFAEPGCANEECDHALGVDGCALDDIDIIRAANPALELRIPIDHVRQERRALPPVEFARERLGWWEDPVVQTGFSLERWSECADRDAVLADPVAFGVDVSPNSASASIVACGGPVELIEHRRGTSWVVPRLVELRDTHRPSLVGLDAMGPAGVLVDDLAKAGLSLGSVPKPDDDPPDVATLTAADMQRACAGILDAVVELDFTHRDQRDLNLAVAGARRRQSGDAWKWSRRDSDVDISPLVAATIARHLWHAHRDDSSVYEGRDLVVLG